MHEFLYHQPRILLSPQDKRDLNSRIYRDLHGDNVFLQGMARGYIESFLKGACEHLGVPWPLPIDPERDDLGCFPGWIVIKVGGMPVLGNYFWGDGEDVCDVLFERLQRVAAERGWMKSKVEPASVSGPGVAVSDRPVVWKKAGRVIDRSE